MSDYEIIPPGGHKWNMNEIQAIIYEWLDAIREKVSSPDFENTWNRVDDLEKIAQIIPVLKRASSKSNYLARRFWTGETHRTKKCPEHKGIWSGIPITESCKCGHTGWLPED